MTVTRAIQGSRRHVSKHRRRAGFESRARSYVTWIGTGQKLHEVGAKGPVIRRPVSLYRPELKMRRMVSGAFGSLEEGVARLLAENGALKRVHEDAERREAKASKQGPIGRGGQPLGEEREQLLQQIFEYDDMKFIADLFAGGEDEFALEFAGELADEYTTLFEIGGQSARQTLGVRGRFNLKAPGVVDALQVRANRLAGSVSKSTFDRLMTVIADEFYLQGKGPRQVARTLQDEFRWLSRTRAEAIARTETGTVVSQGQWTTYRASGVERKRWIATLSDLRTRPTHLDAHGQVKAIDEPFIVGGAELMYPLDPEGPIEEVIQCRCLAPTTRVSATVVAALRSKYVGPMVEITTRAGRQLSVSPNHPVLTRDGLRPAGLLHEGDYLVSDEGWRKDAVVGFPVTDEKNAPATVQDIFDALSARSSMINKRLGPLELHGDAKFVDGKVGVVTADPLLRVDTKAANRQRFSEYLFLLAAVATDRDSTSDKPLKQGAAGNAARLRQREERDASHVLLGNGVAVGSSNAGVARELAFARPAPSSNAVLAQNPGDDLESNAELLRHLIDRSAGLIALDEVVGIRHHHFADHVYDLQTTSGLLSANGIIVHNCDHLPIVDESQLTSDGVWDGENEPDEFARELIEDPDVPPAVKPPPPSDIEDLDFAFPPDDEREKRFAELNRLQRENPTRYSDKHGPFIIVGDSIEIPVNVEEGERVLGKSRFRRALDWWTGARGINPAAKAERDYVRDDIGQFAETEGGGVSPGVSRTDEEDAEIDRQLAENRRRNAERTLRYREAREAAERLDTLPQTPEQAKVIDVLQSFAAAGQMTQAERMLNDVDKAYEFDPAMRAELDKFAKPLNDQDAADADRFLPQEKVTIGPFRYGASEAQIAAARNTEDEIHRRQREIGFLIDKQGNVLTESGDTGNYTSCQPFVGMMRGTYPNQDATGAVLVHNHPNSNGFSRNDLEFGSQSNLAEVRAVGYSGNRFRAQPRADKEWKQVVEAYDRVHAEKLDTYGKQFTRGEITQAEYFFRSNHETFTQLAKDGFISYEYEPGHARR